MTSERRLREAVLMTGISVDQARQPVGGDRLSFQWHTHIVSLDLTITASTWRSRSHYQRVGMPPLSWTHLSTAAHTEELLQQGYAFISQHATDSFESMVESRVSMYFVQRSARA
jgi:hypothetical protein